MTLCISWKRLKGVSSEHKGPPDCARFINEVETTIFLCNSNHVSEGSRGISTKGDVLSLYHFTILVTLSASRTSTAIISEVRAAEVEASYVAEIYEPPCGKKYMSYDDVKPKKKESKIRLFNHPFLLLLHWLAGIGDGPK